MSPWDTWAMIMPPMRIVRRGAAGAPPDTGTLPVQVGLCEGGKEFHSLLSGAAAFVAAGSGPHHHRRYDMYKDIIDRALRVVATHAEPTPPIALLLMEIADEAERLTEQIAKYADEAERLSRVAEGLRDENSYLRARLAAER